MAYTSPEWIEKPLVDLTNDQWEALCDGCGKCCMAKLQDEETLKVYYTNVACELFDAQKCRCQDYDNRHEKVADCIALSLDRPDEFDWLPQTCAYRLRINSKPLPQWHPLITGNDNSTHEANASVQNKTISACGADNLEYHLVDWQ